MVHNRLMEQHLNIVPRPRVLCFSENTNHNILATNSPAMSRESHRLLLDRCATSPNDVELSCYVSALNRSTNHVVVSLHLPQYEGDYYTNTLHCSSRGVVASASSGVVTLISQHKVRSTIDTASTSDVTALRFSTDGLTLALGLRNGHVRLIDAATRRTISTHVHHTTMVGALDYHLEGPLTSGAKDGCVAHLDPRTSHPITVWKKAHKTYICGMSWSPDGRQLATGGDDTDVHLWCGQRLSDSNMETARQTTLVDHVAAVKALAWCTSRRGLLATGAGSTDGHVRLYDTTTHGAAKLMHSASTSSQVCSLLWHPTHPQIISTHGFGVNSGSVMQWYTSCAHPGSSTLR